jgi:uncharacterized membrane protein YdjX (TVP38/TMEM64 family)
MPLRRLASLVPVLIAVVAAAALLPHSPSELRDLVLAAGVAAPVAALAAWVVLTPALFPGTLLAAASGLTFGAIWGTALALGGAVLGGLAAFTLARGPALRLVRRSRALTRAHARLERGGFAAVLAARLMPGVPASGLYYAAGVSPVRRGGFTAAIAIGAILRTTPYVLLGQGLASGSTIPFIIAVASIAIGAGGAMLLLRQLRASVPAS